MLIKVFKGFEILYQKGFNEFVQFCIELTKKSLAQLSTREMSQTFLAIFFPKRQKSRMSDQARSVLVG